MDITAERAKYGLPPLSTNSGVSPVTQSVQTPVQQTLQNTDSLDIDAERAKYNLPPLNPQKDVVPVNNDRSFLSSTGPSFKAGEGAGDLGSNILRTFGNIPSSTRDLTRSFIAPVNPFDTESNVNIGKNAVGIAENVKGIYENSKDIGVGGTLKALGGGLLDTAKKGYDLYRKGGEYIYDKLEENTMNSGSVAGGLKDSAVQLTSTIAKKGIEDPLFFPSMLYGEAKVGGSTEDAISTLAKPITNKVEQTAAKVVDSAKNNAVKELERTYDELLNGQSLSKAKKYKKSVEVTDLKNKAGTTGTSPATTLAEAGIIPKQSGNKLNTLDQAEELRSTTKPLKETNAQALKELETITEPTNISLIESNAIRNIMKGSGTDLAKEDAVTKIKKSFDASRRSNGDNISLSLQDSLKSSHWDATKFDTAVPQLDRDVNYAIAKAYQKNIESVASKAGYEEVAQLNRHIGDKLEAAKFLEGLHNKIIRGGSLTKLVYGTVGSTIAKSPLGKVLGFVGGEAVANLLVSTKIAGPFKRLLLKNIERQDPVAYTKALKWLEERGMLRDTQLALPAPRFTVAQAAKDTSGIDKVRTQEMTDYYNNLPKKNQLALPEGKSDIAGTGKTISLPKETASTITNRELNNDLIRTPESTLKSNKLFGNKGNSNKYISGNGKFVSKDAETIIDLNKELSKTDRYLVMDDLQKENPKLYKEVIEFENLERYRNASDNVNVLTGKNKSFIQRIKDIPNKQGGFAKNPFVRKDIENERILKSLSEYDPLPVTSSRGLEFGDDTANFRLDELKALNDKRLLKPNEIQEASDLLKKVGAI